MSEWRECKLGDVAEVQTGPFGSQLHQKDYVPIGTPLITVKNIGENKIIDDKIDFVSNQDKERLSKYILQEGDIVFSRVGYVDRRAYITQKENGWMFSGSTLRIRVKESSGLDSKFLSYYFGQPSFKQEIINMSVGATRPSLNTQLLEETDISLPPLPEQRAIASVLSSLDDKIDLLQRENKTLEAMAEALFRQWFIEEAKDDWEHTKLGEVVTITYGKNLPIKKLLRSGYPVFGGNGQIGFYNKYLYVEPQVLVSCRGEASGKVNISLPRSFITNNSLILVRDKRKEITFEYLKYHSLNYDFTLHVSGSAQPQITIDSLYDAAFLIPPVDLINKFTEIVRGYEEKRTNNLKQIHTLEKLRDTLLPKLMSGEVRVKYEEEEMASCRA